MHSAEWEQDCTDTLGACWSVQCNMHVHNKYLAIHDHNDCCVIASIKVIAHKCHVPVP